MTEIPNSKKSGALKVWLLKFEIYLKFGAWDLRFALPIQN